MCLWEVGETVPTIKTPGVWLTTATVGVPHMTPETLSLTFGDLLGDLFAGQLVPFEKHARTIDIFEAWNKGYKSYANLPLQGPCLVTIRDPLKASKRGYNTNKAVSVWGESNQRHSVDTKEYTKGIKALKPEAIVALNDGDTPKNCPAQKVNKCVMKNLKYLDETLEGQSDNNLAVLAALQGGYDSQSRIVCATQTASRPVDGYTLDGFHYDGPEALDLDMEEVTLLVKDSLDHVPAEKVRCYFGMCDPAMILKLVSVGVDMFESSYALHMADQGLALSFPNRLNDAKVPPNETLNNDDNDQIESKSYFMNMRQAKYKNDFGPILQNCSCYTCRKHTRAYINHLLATNELLAPILLVTHNLFHYATFFRTIRQSMAEDKFEQFSSSIYRN